MPAKLSAFVVWALVAAGVVFWGYRLWAGTPPAPANVQTVADGPAARGDWSRLLGTATVPEKAAAPVAVESTRFRLFGVLAPKAASDPARPSTAGVALIAIDGRPARAYAVGARVDGELVLQSISRRSVSVGPVQGAPVVVLELPPPPLPTTGVLPSAVPEGEPGRAMPPGPMPRPPPPLASSRPPVPQANAQPEPDDESADNEEAVTPPRPRFQPNALSR